jgi:hypothetical protein
MLEHDALILTPSADSGCLILQPNSGKQVGAVRPAPTGRGFLFRCFARPYLAIYESEDEPLLCTLNRLFRLREVWELRDADGHLVGKLTRAALSGQAGRRFTRALSPDRREVRFIDSRGQVAASLSSQEERVLTFGVESKCDPFTRMLILGSALLEIWRDGGRGR